MDPTPSLRERKRLETMRRAQRVALELFDEYGFEQVTIERIAHEAEVSASTIYRHFGTKEQLVLWDEYDPRILERIDEELRRHPPLEAVEMALAEVYAEVAAPDEGLIQRRLRYALQEPGVQAAVALEMEMLSHAVEDTLSRHREPEADPLETAVLANAIVGALVAALRHWHATGHERPFEELISRTFAVLRDGLADR